MATAQRCSIANGIWLCRFCGTVIDEDPERYTTELLREWREAAEQAAQARLVSPRTSLPGEGGLPAFITAAVEQRFDSLSTVASSAVLDDLEQQRVRWREGRQAEVNQWIANLVDSPGHLEVLDPVIAARVLRFRAGIVLESRVDTDSAADWLKRARALDPAGDDRRLRALIAWRRGDEELAFATLDEDDTLAGRNLRIGLLLDAGRITDAVAALQEPPLESDRSMDATEHWRLRVLVYLATKDIKAADHALSEARARTTTWTSIQQVTGLLRYFQGLSVIVLPVQLPAWPQPIDSALVRGDAAGNRALAEAADAFTALLERESKGEARRQLEAWRLASLAHMPNQLGEATAYCRALLEKDPAHPYALVWAIHLDCEVDLDVTLAALSAEVVNTGNVGHLVALANGYLSTGRTLELANLLDRELSCFEKEGAEDLWRFWRAQAHLASGQGNSAEKLATILSPDAGRAFRTTVLQQQAAETGDTEPLLAYLEEAAQVTGDSRFLLTVCEYRARAGQWEYVSQHGPAMAGHVDTVESWRLVAFAFHHMGKFESCVEVIRQLLDRGVDGSIENDLRRMRANALTSLGAVPDALAELRSLAAAPGLTVDLVNLARLSFTAGNRDQVAATAEVLRGCPDLDATDALMLAYQLGHTHVALAQRLWRIAVARGLPDHAVGQAVMLAHELALDGETESLMSRMAGLAAAGGGGFTVVPISELSSMGEEWHSQRQQVLSAYAKGEIPIHAVADRLNLSLVHLHHVMLANAEARPEPLQQFALRVRSGGREVSGQDSFSSPPRSLAFDLTALLLAHHLDLLPSIEKAFDSLYLPHSIMWSLHEELRTLKHHQPSRLSVDRQILDAEQQGWIRIRTEALPELSQAEIATVGVWADWLARLELARVTGAFVLDFPLSEQPEVIGPPSQVAGQERLSRLISPRAIVDALQSDGALDTAEAARAVAALGASGVAQDIQQLIAPGSTLYCPRGAIDVLVEAKLLPVLAQQFRLVVESKDQVERRQTLDAVAKSTVTIEWLDGLIHQLADGIAAGTYRLLPVTHLQTQSEERFFSLSARVRLLASLMAAPVQLDALWIDDRYVNRHTRAGSVRIVDLLDVLGILQERGTLNKDERWRAVMRLRASNVRFLPLTADELVYHLFQARIEGDELQETRSLEALRRSFGATLAAAGELQLPPAGNTEPNSVGELPFLVVAMRAITDGLVKIWRDSCADGVTEESIRQARIRSQWVIDQLYVDMGILRAVIVHPDRPPESGVSAVGLVGLLASAFGLLDTNKLTGDSELDKLAREYLAWVSSAIIEQRCNNDLRLRSGVVKRLQEQLLWLPTLGRKRPGGTKIARLFAARLFRALPAWLGDAVGRRASVRRALRITNIEAIEVEGVGLPAREVLEAIAAAQAGEIRHVCAIEGDVKVTFHPPAGSEIFGVLVGEAQATLTGTDPVWRALAPSVTERETVLLAERATFDVDAVRWARLVSQIAAVANISKRYAQIQELRERSVSGRYSALAGRWRADMRLTFEDLRPPSRSDLMQHLRLSTRKTTRFHKRWDAAAEIVLREEVPDDAWLRLSGLPVSLPARVEVYVRAMPRADRRALIRRVLHMPSSPIARLHGIRLLLQLGVDEPVYSRLAHRVIRTLGTAKWDVEVRVFSALLKLACEHLEADGQKADYAALLAGAWCHAHRLTTALLVPGVNVNSLAERLEQWQSPKTETVFRWNPILGDLAHPHQFSAVRFTFAGIQYALGTKPALLRQTANELLSTYSTHEIDGHRVPHVDLWLNTCGLANRLKAFLALDDTSLTVPLQDWLSPTLSIDSKRQAVQESIIALEKDPNGFDHWMPLWLVLGEGQPESELRSRLATILLQLRLQAIVAAAGDKAPIPIRCACRQAAVSGVVETVAYLRGQLHAVAGEATLQEPLPAAGSRPEIKDGQNSLEHGAASQLTPLQMALLDGALLLARAQGSVDAAVRAFAEDLSALSEADPIYHSVGRSAVEAFVTQLPLAQAYQFSLLLARIRASAPRRNRKTVQPGKSAT